MISCLGHIRATWLRLVRGNEEALQKFSTTDVKTLELRCPRYSTHDETVIKRELDQKRLFSRFSPEERQAIWTELTAIDCIIPSLFTFFEDIKVLQSCAESMKHLILPIDKTFDRALRDSLTQGQMESEIEEAHIDLSIRQLWIYSMRNFRNLSQQPRRSIDKLLAKVPPEQADESKLARFAKLADQCGFHTPEIDYLKQLTLGEDEELVSFYKTSRITNNKLTRSQTNNLTPAIVSDSINATPRRCGLPTHATYEHNRRLLTVEFLHFDYGELNPRGRDITSFFVLQSTYFAFFGHPPTLTDQNSLPIGNVPMDESVDDIPSDNVSMEDSHVENMPLNEQITQYLRQDSDSGSSSYSTDPEVELGTMIADNEDESTPEREPSLPESDTSPAQDTDDITEPEPRTNVPEDIFETSPRPSRAVIFIPFINNKLDNANKFVIAQASPKAVEYAAKRFMFKNKLRPFSTPHLHLLMPDQCFEAATNSSSRTIILLPEGHARVSRTLERAVSELPQVVG